MKKLFYLLLAAIASSFGIVMVRAILQDNNNPREQHPESSTYRIIKEQDRQLEKSRSHTDSLIRYMDSLNRGVQDFNRKISADSAYYAVHHKYPKH